MKLKYVEKISQDGEVKIPKDYQKELGLYPGAEVQFRREGGRLLIERVKEAVADKQRPTRDPVDELTGLIPVEDPKLIDELLATEDIYG
jgi:bifunctional DNA-binding transcriptional regulator/antitoxin component of YhaV-PrlF toxin-antitoxin module